MLPLKHVVIIVSRNHFMNKSPKFIYHITGGFTIHEQESWRIFSFGEKKKNPFFR